MDKARIYVDFNELVDENTVLLSKDDTKMDSDGNIISFYEGMSVSIYSDDLDDDGGEDNLIAEGIAVKRDLSDYGHWDNVKWCCCFDKNSIIHESELRKKDKGAKIMQTILIVLNSEKLENPDLDIRYDLPDKLERYTQNEISDNGYDHLTNTELGIWLETQSAKENYGKIVEFFEQHMVCGNDLSGTAKVYISEKEAASLEECILVYDGEEAIPDEAVRVTNRVSKAGKIISKIAELITNEDADVVGQLETELCDLQEMEEQWECCTSVLKKYKYIFECDEDVELSGFVQFLKESASIKANDLSVKENKFDGENDLYEWCESLDEMWSDAGYCMAIYETENENEVVFPCSVEKLEEISELAKEICINVMAVAEY